MNIRRRAISVAAASVAIALAAAPAQAAFLASLDFDAPFAVAPGVAGVFGPLASESAAVGAWNAAGWSGNYAVNRSTGDPASFTSLSLGGLPAHTSISASFILGFLESWDSRDGTVTPDNLEIWIDGVQVAQMTSNNASGTIMDFDGGTVIASGVQANSNTFFSDTLVNMSTAPFLTFAHSASALTIDFRASGAGWQGGGDEAWGIDNIQLTYENADAVPEPGTLALLGLGLAGLGLSRRRKAS